MTQPYTQRVVGNDSSMNHRRHKKITWNKETVISIYQKVGTTPASVGEHSHSHTVRNKTTEWGRDDRRTKEHNIYKTKTASVLVYHSW